MRVFQRKAAVRSVFATLALALAAGCASFGPSGPPEEQVRVLAEQRWRKLMDKKLEDAYKYTAPSYRALVDFDQYRSTFGGAVAWVGADVVSVKCEPERCAVRMHVEVAPPRGLSYSGTISTAVSEVWVLEQGRWWLFLKP